MVGDLVQLCLTFIEEHLYDGQELAATRCDVIRLSTSICTIGGKQWLVATRRDVIPLSTSICTMGGKQWLAASCSGVQPALSGLLTG